MALLAEPGSVPPISGCCWPSFVNRIAEHEHCAYAEERLKNLEAMIGLSDFKPADCPGIGPGALSSWLAILCEQKSRE